ncbi:MAG: hypothetical protein KKG64_02880 [Firmicutes bacterium]|nr:hypothetical protein [Bacillota bacterium]
MLKWIGRALYVMIISILSLQIYSYAYYSKLQEYYNDNVSEYIDDDTVFLNGINTLMGIDYYRESPILYEYIKDDGDFQITVRAYAIGIMSDNTYYDGFMILVNHVLIVEDGATLEDPIIKINVELDTNTLMVSEELTNRGSIYFDSLQPFAYYNVPVLFLFDAEDYLKVPNQDAFANLTRIEVEYSNREVDDDKNLIYNESPLFLATAVATSESALNKDATLAINVNDYRLRLQFENDVPSEIEMITFNLNDDRGDMNPYNWLIWRTMLVYVLIVAIVTYLLFFHKIVRERYKTKNYGIRKDGSKSVDAEPIFKDIEYKNKRL